MSFYQWDRNTCYLFNLKSVGSNFNMHFREFSGPVGSSSVSSWWAVFSDVFNSDSVKLANIQLPLFVLNYRSQWIGKQRCLVRSQPVTFTLGCVKRAWIITSLPNTNRPNWQHQHIPLLFHAWLCKAVQTQSSIVSVNDRVKSIIVFTLSILTVEAQGVQALGSHSANQTQSNFAVIFRLHLLLKICANYRYAPNDTIHACIQRAPLFCLSWLLCGKSPKIPSKWVRNYIFANFWLIFFDFGRLHRDAKATLVGIENSCLMGTRVRVDTLNLSFRVHNQGKVLKSDFCLARHIWTAHRWQHSHQILLHHHSLGFGEKSTSII